MMCWRYFSKQFIILVNKLGQSNQLDSYFIIEMTVIRSLFIILLAIFLQLLTISSKEPNSGLTMNIVTSSGSILSNMVFEGKANSSFLINRWQCSWNLFIYNQNQQGHRQYYLDIFGLAEEASVLLSTNYQQISLNYSSISCQPRQQCKIQVHNNCSSVASSLSEYYYLINVNVSGYGSILSYYVLCDQERYDDQNIFYGTLLLQIFIVSAIICLVALHSRAWSLDGHIFDFNVWWIVVFHAALIALDGLMIYSVEGTNYVVDAEIFWVAVTFGGGCLGVAICLNELLFQLRVKFLQKPLCSRKFRVAELVSLMLVCGVMVSWWFVQDNILINDLISLCMVIGFVKILTFRSLKMAGLAILVSTVIELAFDLIIAFHNDGNWYLLLLNTYYSPFLLQIPQIRVYLYRQCSWLYVPSIIFTGMMFSYLHRFDISRSTKLYFIVETVAFSIGGVLWIFFMSLPIFFLVPFGLITEACMFGLVCLFAYRRQELMVLWNGTFYDYDIQSKDELFVVLAMITEQRRSNVRELESGLMEELRQITLPDNESQIEDSCIKTVVSRLSKRSDT